jgi:hypothetical protein
MLQTIQVDGQVLRQSLSWALSHASKPILCIYKGPFFKLAFMGGIRLAVSCQTRRPTGEQGEAFFVIPSMTAQTLMEESFDTSPSFWQVHVENKQVTVTRPQLPDVSWESDVTTLGAPPQFGEMVVPPRGLLPVDYLAFADAVHHSIAKLVEKDASEAVHRNRLAVLINLQRGNLVVNGTEITRSRTTRFYFDPRLIVRSLEYLNERRVSIGIKPLGLENRGILYLVGHEKTWTICCGLLSISLDTQKLYPLAPRDNN